MADKDGSPNHVAGAFVGLIGFIVVVFCNFLYIFVSLFLPEVLGLGLLFIGVTQLIYVVPLILLARTKKWPGFIGGAVVAASLTFLLNAGCYGLLISLVMVA